MTIRLRRLAALAPVLASALALAAPPPAPSEPVVDTLHGVRIEDPFRNLEKLRDPRTRAWLEAQAAYGEAQLARIDGREALSQRIAELSRSAGDAVREVRRFPGERVYYLKRRAGENQFKLMLRTGEAAERVLVDPQQFARDGVPHAINWYVPSWDGRTLAFGLSAAGSEDAALHLIDVASGRRCASRCRACARSTPASRRTAAVSPSTRTARCRRTRPRPRPTSTPRSSCSTSIGRRPSRGRSSAESCCPRSVSNGSTSARCSSRPTAAGWWRVPPTPPCPRAGCSSRRWPRWPRRGRCRGGRSAAPKTRSPMRSCVATRSICARARRRRAAGCSRCRCAAAGRRCAMRA
ncbi:hypothetical protein FSC37_15270 [Piscinibacter aquaticus]|uniref:Peptidase S9A N-terminal domain-containing protein n=1 Tax=Piscinibacter aquaticus TaxID=392597 RepID=A0A5C6U4R5_9BURK|nr:hypothetical protein FSC37_15270 [Piscinibacter aquaticus]